MSILINRDTKIVIQGITSKYGTKQLKKMLEFGSNVVAGVAPGKGGTQVMGVPVYDTAKEAVHIHGANAGIVYVPAAAAKDASIELINSGVKLVMIAAEGIPIHDTMQIKKSATANSVWVVGPNTIGLISPEQCMLGSLAHEFTKIGNIGVVTRGGTIAVELARILTEAGFGQSTVIGAGGDRVLGSNPAEYLKAFEHDPDTKAIVLNGEIGGEKELQCAEVIKHMTKPVFAYILGRCAPTGKRMGHIGAIVGGLSEGFDAKRAVLSAAGAIVVDTPWEIVERLITLGIKDEKSTNL